MGRNSGPESASFVLTKTWQPGYAALKSIYHRNIISEKSHRSSQIKQAKTKMALSFVKYHQLVKFPV